jgi:hypothetical protein
MAAITEDSMVAEFFEIWETKVRAGLTPAAALAQIQGERPDLTAIYVRGEKTQLAREMKKGAANGKA